MSYLPANINNAGKITVVTAVIGLFVFATFFLFNFGAQELQRATAADIATTTLRVLNTPPAWTASTTEEVASATSTPTNSGDEVAWVAIGTDPSNQPYFLLICDDDTEPIAATSTLLDGLGTAPPSCAPGVTQWAVSTSTVSGTQARAATTTTEAMAEVNQWYAWICDDDPDSARCNAAFTQGDGDPDTASPFHVNHRPVFTSFTTAGPVLPGENVTFTTVATDNDIVPTNHTIKLFVCNTDSFNVMTQTCGGTLLASSTFVTDDPSATYFIDIPTRDQNYNSYGFIVDEYGHAADPQGGLALITVLNAPPDVDTSTIELNNSGTMVLSVPEGETAGFTLSFQLTDNNSCVDNNGDPEEIDGYELAIFRTTIGTSSCEASDTDDYDPNNCYVSALDTAVWNLACTASTTTCGGPTDPSIRFDCTFPLWHVADATDGVDGTDTVHWDTDWSAAIRAIDNDGATSSYKISDSGVDVSSLMTYALDTDTIPYGQLEVGQFTPNLIATTTFRATGNVGLNQLLSGNSMCENYSISTPCDDNSSTSTIRYDNQVYASSSVTFATASSSGNFLPASSTPVEFELEIPKNTSTTTSNVKETFWGIRVPGTITFSGSYRGQNFFEGVKSDPSTW